MTFCVALSVHKGLLFTSDSGATAAVNTVPAFSKINSFEVPGDLHRCCIVAVNTRNLAATLGVVCNLRRKARGHGLRLGFHGLSHRNWSHN